MEQDKSNYLFLIKKIQETLEDVIEYQDVPKYFQIINEEYEHDLKSIKENLESYYSNIQELVQIDKKFIKSNDYFLFSTFTQKIQEITKFSPAQLRSLIYSPQSVQFLYRTFNKLLNPYFSKEISITSKDELASNVLAKIGQNISGNMKYCPKYLQILLSNKFEDLTPEVFFIDYIIEEIFKNPHIFHLLEFNQVIAVSEDELANMKNEISYYSKEISMVTLFNKKNIETLDSIPKYELNPKNKKFYSSLQKFQDLIRISKLPEEIPPNIAENKFDCVINQILIQKDNQIQKDLFNNIMYLAKKQDKIKDSDLEDHFTNGLKLLLMENLINYYKLFLNGTFFQAQAYSYVVNNNQYNIHSKAEYIDNPSIFAFDLAKMTFKSNGSFARFFSKLISKDYGNSINESTLSANPSDPLFCNMFLTSGLTFDEFKLRRPALTVADQSFTNLQLSQNYNDPNLVEHYNEYLWELFTTNNSEFDKIVSFFVSSFLKNADPYNKARMMSKSYSYVAEKLSSLTKFEQDSLDDLYEEEKFIITLFKLANPPNIITNFVYLFEFLIAPAYSEIYENNNIHINNVENLFQTYLSKYNFDYIQYCKIMHSTLNINVKSLDEFKNFYQAIKNDSVPGSRKIEFELNEEALENLEKTPDLSNFTFRFKLYFNEENESDINSYSLCICSINITSKKLDALPNNKIEFIKFVERKLKKDKK